APCFLGPNPNFVQRQLPVIQGQIKWVMKSSMTILHFVDQNVAKFFCRQRLSVQNSFSGHASPQLPREDLKIEDREWKIEDCYLQSSITILPMPFTGLLF